MQRVLETILAILGGAGAHVVAVACGADVVTASLLGLTVAAVLGHLAGVAAERRAREERADRRAERRLNSLRLAGQRLAAKRGWLTNGASRRPADVAADTERLAGR